MVPLQSHDPSESLNRILASVALSGGAFLFLEEGLTGGARQLMSELQQKSWPVALRSLASLTIRASTQTQDVLFVGEVSREVAHRLAASCLCKLLKDKSNGVWDESLFDAEWDSKNTVQIIPWLSQVRPSSLEPVASALFLDRDDVVVRNVPYNKDPEKVLLVPGVVELIQRAHQKSQLVIICSNQSGLGRGMVTLEEFRQVQQRMLKLLAEQGAWIDDCYWASYISGSSLRDEDLLPQMRKPRPGMFLQAAYKWNIDLSKSQMVGDSATDLIAAYRAGVRGLYLFSSIKSAQEMLTLTHFQGKYADFLYEVLESFKEI